MTEPLTTSAALFGDISEEKLVVAAAVPSPPRLRKPERDQGEMFTESLDGRIESDHTVRTVWLFVEQLDLSSLLSQIKSVQGHQGRNATDPRILLALWLYASIEGVGSARQLEQLCEDHRAYQWICGKVSVNYHTLSDFRTGQGKQLDELLARSIASLVKEGLVDVNTVAQDGMRIRASAGGSSFRREGKLQEHLEQAKKHLVTLKAEIEMNPAQLESRRRKALLRAAQEKKGRLEQAMEHVREIAQGREARKKGDGEQARASKTDPEARRMKMPDGGTRPAYNAQFVTDTKTGVVVGVDATNAGHDANQLIPMVKEVRTNTGKQPENVLADGGYSTKKNVNWAAESQIVLYTPVKDVEKQLKKGKDPYAPHKGDSPAMIEFRKRMNQDESKAMYQMRGQTAEWVNAQARNRGLYRVNVRSKEKVRAVLVLMVLAHNLLRAEKLREQRKKEDQAG
jgi:transposase